MATSSYAPHDSESDKFTTEEEKTSTAAPTTRVLAACRGESQERSSQIRIDLNTPPPPDDATVDAAEEPTSDQQSKKRAADDAAPHADSYPPAKRTAVDAEQREDPSRPRPKELYSPWHIVDAVTDAGIETSFESFPYYLCDVTKEELLSCAYPHLHLSMNNINSSSSPDNAPSLRLPSLSRFLRLSGPPGSNIYQETLAKALAKEFGAALVIYDPVPIVPGASVQGNKVKFPTLPQILSDASRISKYCTPLVVFLSDVYVRDIEQTIADPVTDKLSVELNARLELMPQGVLVIGSHVLGPEEEEPPFDVLIRKQSTMAVKDKPQITRIFPTNYVTFRMPREERQALSLNRQLDLDCETLRDRRNISKILYFLDLAGWTCDTDLDTISIKDEVLTNEAVDRIVGFAVSHHLRTKGFPKDDGRVLSTLSIEHGLKLIEAIRTAAAAAAAAGSKESAKDVVAYNEYEKRVLTEVIPPKEMGVAFDDVGALDVVKDALWESVLLPLQRPELFRRGRLTKPCKGILLFGPPGTGKTMLAKAVATEAGANFITISMSSITSRWYGEVEKYVKAVFTLASKLAPCVVFIDEVDSMLSSRGRYEEHEVSRRLKNEFMTNWDGLGTKEDERVLVLATTNRPFDLDEAVVRRFQRRLMVGLPDASNREKILRVILSEEELAQDVDFAAVAKITDGFSGSDLRNLCAVAAHRPLREVLEKEKKKRRSSASASGEPPLGGDLEDIRALQMDDFVYARKHVGASASSSSDTVSRLVEWNNMYGEDGAKEKKVLSYFM